ncbi:hypothetical protein U1Q18_017570 [Sarracenia purpurea var. burkii]
MIDNGSKHSINSPSELGSPPAVARAEEDSVGDESDLLKRAIAPVNDGLKHGANSPFQLESPLAR